jgi:pimeloyl-ACP methyl ester carboxylesterase
MAHGLGGTRDAGLAPYAERFATAGFGVLVFDYRHFGDSEGQPRQLASIQRQLQDWRNAVAFARGLPGVDPDRIALWGSSFSGGHVVVVAAQDKRVAALSAQGPMMDGWAALANFLGYAGAAKLLRLAGLGVLDLVRALAGRPALSVPVIAKPGELAAMSSPDAYDGYRALAPPDWRNELCARFALTLGTYRPVLYAARVTCPALIQVCRQDSVAPAAAAVATARRVGRQAELKLYDCGHFDIYVGGIFERAVRDQLAFFNRVLRPHKQLA